MRLLIGVASSAEATEAREGIRGTWASKLSDQVSVLFFGPDEPEVPEPDRITHCGEDEAADPEGLLSFLRWAHDHAEFEQLFLCRDHSLMSMELLVALAANHSGVTAAPGTGSSPLELSAGILLCRKAVEQLLAQKVDLNPHETNGILKWIPHAIPVARHPGLRWSHSRIPGCGHEIISAGWCSPARMRVLHHLNRFPTPWAFQITWNGRSGRLRLEADGRFSESLTCRDGQWRPNQAGGMDLLWCDGEEQERLGPTSFGFAGPSIRLIHEARTAPTVSQARRHTWDLRSLPVVVTSGWRFTERRRKLAAFLQDHGFTQARFYHAELNDGKPSFYPSITLNHLTAIASQPAPFILLEDDATPTRWFTSKLEIPEDADAVWLGITRYGILKDEPSPEGAGFHGSPDLPRVTNMLGSHAVLFIEPDFVNSVRDELLKLLRTQPEQPHDRMLAALQQRWMVYATNPPLFYQNDGHEPCVTNERIDVGDE